MFDYCFPNLLKHCLTEMCVTDLKEYIQWVCESKDDWQKTKVTDKE